MLTVFFGNDVVLVRKKAHERVRLYEERGDTVLRVTPETFEQGILNDLAGATSLFAGTQIILLDSLGEDELVFEEVMNDVGMMVESGNAFIMIEGKLNATHKKILTTSGAEGVETNEPEKIKFNSFQLADALLERDKRALWFLLMRAWREGLSPEEIIGTLFWQMKMLRLAEKTKTAEEAGQKPYVYGKSKRALKNFKNGELETFSRDLLSIYHEGHQGIRDIDIALERWVLAL